MQRWFWLVPLGLVLSASLAGSTPLSPQKPATLELAPFASQLLPMPFHGQQRALVIASGDGSSPLGLYVYDRHGNCVAWDEARAYVTRDDLAAEWVPPEAGLYLIEVRNAGWRTNSVTVAIR